MRLARHQFVYVDPAAWPGIVDAHPQLALLPEVREWAALRRPLIARRACPGDPDAAIPLGLPLPPSMGKQRLALTVAPQAVRLTGPPPLLAIAQRVVPDAWRSVIAELAGVDREVRCFGSLAWQYLTGLAYLSAASDVDLLWPVTGADDADALVAAVARIQARASMRIDGEIVTPDGLAVQWREWASGAPEVLAKTRDDARPLARGAVLS